jgi:hypothetical protein
MDALKEATREQQQARQEVPYGFRQAAILGGS